MLFTYKFHFFTSLPLFHTYPPINGGYTLPEKTVYLY